jgi:hypothetical protein
LLKTGGYRLFVTPIQNGSGITFRQEPSPIRHRAARRIFDAVRWVQTTGRQAAMLSKFYPRQKTMHQLFKRKRGNRFCALLLPMLKQFAGHGLFDVSAVNCDMMALP